MISSIEENVIERRVYMHQSPPPSANIPAQILVGKTRAKIGGQRARNIEALTQCCIKGASEKEGRVKKKRKKSCAAAGGGTANSRSDANLTW